MDAVSPVLVPALTAFMSPPEHRRLSGLSRSWWNECETHVPTYAMTPEDYAVLRHLQLHLSQVVYWSIVRFATGLDTNGLISRGALFYAVQFNDSAVQPTVSVGDHALLLLRDHVIC